MKIFAKRNTSTYLLILTIMAALAAGFLGIKTVEKYTNALPVVVAKTDIPPYTEITVDMVTIENLPKAAIKKGMFGTPEAVIGKITQTSIPTGFPVSQSFLAIDGPGSILTTQISQFEDPKLRAVPVRVDGINVLPGKLLPGDRVDVIGSMKLPVGGIQKPVSQIIGIQVPILSLMGDPASPNGVVLALTPQQAQDIGFAETAGEIKLSLNPYQPDLKAAKTTPTTPESFVDKYITASQNSQAPVDEQGGEEQ